MVHYKGSIILPFIGCCDPIWIYSGLQSKKYGGDNKIHWILFLEPTTLKNHSIPSKIILKQKKCQQWLFQHVSLLFIYLFIFLVLVHLGHPGCKMRRRTAFNLLLQTIFATRYDTFQLLVDMTIIIFFVFR